MLAILPWQRRRRLADQTARSTIIFLISRNRLGRVQTFRTGLGAVHDGVAAVELERIFQLVQTLARGLVAAVDDPAIGMQQSAGPR